MKRLQDKTCLITAAGQGIGRASAIAMTREGARKAFIAQQPIGRIGQPEEIAALVIYLALDESTYTTGISHLIDGGWSNI